MILTEAAKISALDHVKSRKMNITGEEILPSDQSRMIKKPHLVILP